jgi:glycosyltransferase involved in cell wall biosynthesis
MTKILIIDTPAIIGGQSVFKCTGPLMEELKYRPDVELRWNIYADPDLMSWADVIWVEPGEYAAVLASQRKYDDTNHSMWNDQENRYGPGGSKDWSHAKLIIRHIDIDVLFRSYRGIKWENVDHQLFIAKTMERHVREEPDSVWPESLKLTTLPLGLDMSKYTYRERDPKGNGHIAFVAEIWGAKNLPMAIQAFAALVKETGSDWHLHILGRWSGEQVWLSPYIEHIKKELGVADLVTHDLTTPDVNAWLEDKDYLFTASSKEAFSLVTAEAAAKGMKALTHNWPGASDLWPEDMVWTSIDEFVHKMQTPIDSKRMRDVVSKYDFKTAIYPQLEKIIFG